MKDRLQIDCPIQCAMHQNRTSQGSILDFENDRILKQNSNSNIFIDIQIMGEFMPDELHSYMNLTIREGKDKMIPVYSGFLLLRADGRINLYRVCTRSATYYNYIFLVGYPFIMAEHMFWKFPSTSSLYSALI